MDDYNQYEKIEQHIEYSRLLTSVNSRGKIILKELEKQKNINGKKKLLSNVYNVYHLIENIIKPRSLCNNLYSSLIYYMDELMFMEVVGLNSFIIEDDEYPLYYIYFNTDDWLTDDCIDSFVLDKCVYINDTESILISCFIDEYEGLLINIEKYIYLNGHKDTIIARKLLRICTRLKKRLVVLKAIILQILNKNLEKVKNKKFESCLNI